ncbi:MAG: TIGR04255 family protein [Mesorhizobium sp.]|nr:MAG: TIGR04255 family protein [Mesorhizobium sp.]
MRIPPSDRVVFGANPLAEVLCQLKFPRLLEIDQEVPLEFHRSIRKHFAEIITRSSVELMIDPQSGGPPTQLMRPMYDFIDSDRNRRITLSSDFVALTFGRYEDWGQFRASAILMLGALRNAYEVSQLTRAGLRYRNIIDRVNLGLEGVSWNELIRPEVLGLAAAGIFDESDLQELSSSYFGNSDGAMFRINVGLVKRAESDVTGFMIDTDLAKSGKLGVTDHACIEILDRFNSEAGNIFRWCIKDRLRAALKPR